MGIQSFLPLVISLGGPHALETLFQNLNEIYIILCHVNPLNLGRYIQLSVVHKNEGIRSIGTE